MANTLDEMFSDLTQSEMLIVGVALTLFSYLVVFLIWTRIVRYAKDSGNSNDIEAISFLKPFIHMGTLLTGLYFTVKYAFPDEPTYLENTSKFIFIVAILTTALSLRVR